MNYADRLADARKKRDLLARKVSRLRRALDEMSEDNWDEAKVQKWQKELAVSKDRLDDLREEVSFLTEMVKTRGRT